MLLEKQYLAVEGLIACGKTTLLESLNGKIKTPIFNESLEKWKSLPDFYQNPKLFAYFLQVEILCSYKELFSETQAKVFITESSPSASVYVFSKMHENFGNSTQDQAQSLKQYLQSYLAQPTCICYLEVSPELAYQRVKQRNREVETSLTLDYLIQLEAASKV